MSALVQQEGQALIEAAKEGSGICSLVDLWSALGMQRSKDLRGGMAWKSVERDRKPRRMKRNTKTWKGNLDK